MRTPSTTSTLAPDWRIPSSPECSPSPTGSRRGRTLTDSLMAVDGDWHHVVIAVTDYGRTMETYLDGTDTNQGWDDEDFTSAQAQEAKAALESAHSKLSEFRPAAPSASTGKNPPKEEPEEKPGDVTDQPVEDLPFGDVDKASWYAQSVANIYAKGYSADLFGGEDNITREQAVVTLYRCAQSLKVDMKANLTALDTFTDSAEVSDWAKEAMAWAVDVGLVQGRGSNDLAPLADVTRAEIATLLNRFAKLFLTEADPTAAGK